MSSLYEISNDILSIFNAIESQDGEITDEQYSSLTIKENELKNKLNDYVKAIKEFQKDADFCKAEKKSINDRQNVYKNRVERLKTAALEAVINFGQEGKTNKFVELPNYRLFTKSSKSIEVDENRINIFMKEFERYIRELVSQGVLYAGKDVDLQGIIDSINANIRAEQGEEFKPFSIGDLLAIKVNISQAASIYDLFKSGLALNMYGQEPIYTKIESVIDKMELKSITEAYENSYDKNKVPTISKIVVNQSLQIK